MAAQFGVSRPLLREALAELRAEGFVDTSAGGGPSSVTRARPTWPMRSSTSAAIGAGPGPPPTTSTRRARPSSSSPPSSPLSERRRTRSRRWSGCCNHDGQRHDAAAYTAADVGFHIAVARATQNPLLPTLLAPLATIIVRGMFASHGQPDAVSLGIKAHSKVLRDKSATPPRPGGPWPRTCASRGCVSRAGRQAPGRSGRSRPGRKGRPGSREPPN